MRADRRAEGPAPAEASANEIDVKATKVASAAIATGCARVGCGVKLDITSDEPIDVALPGCNRTVHSDGGGLPIPLP